MPAQTAKQIEKRLEIDYRPYPHQQKIHDGIRKHRFSVVVTHRRAGKTVAAVNHLIAAALSSQRVRPRFAYVAPTLKMAKKIAWDYVKDFTKPIPGVKYNESELRCDLPNGAQITLFGVDSPDSMRGLYFDGLILDEYGMMPLKTFSEIIRPTLADRRGWCVFQGTPNGRNQFYDSWLRAQKDEDWFLAVFKWSDTNILPADEIEEMRKDMSDEEFQQEMECSFQASVRGAYYASQLDRAVREDRITQVFHDPALPVNTAWDIGVGDSTSIWFYQTYRNEIRLIDYYEMSGEGFHHYAKILGEKPYTYEEHCGPHDLRVREMSTGRTRYEMAGDLGIDFYVLPKIPLDDGINAARSIFSRCWFDEEACHRGIDCLFNYKKQFDERLGVYRTKPVHDWASHGADAFRYLALAVDARSFSDKPKNVNVIRTL